MTKWSHVVEGSAIHLLGRNEMCSCKASHVCQSCQGQDERLRVVNTKLLSALEHSVPYMERAVKFFKYQRVGHEFYPNREEAEANIQEARAAIEEARK